MNIFEKIVEKIPKPKVLITVCVGTFIISYGCCMLHKCGFI